MIAFAALMPDASFSSQVLEFKRRLRERVGPQLYLDDPPHVTLYLADFPHPPQLGEVAHGLTRPSATVSGWRVFQNDLLTGNHTLTCDFHVNGRQLLSTWQRRVIETLAPMRDPHATCVRYGPVWAKLPPWAQENIDRVGFPYVGDVWLPHVTVASVRPADWHAAWNELANSAPSCVMRFSELCLFALENERPVLLERIALEADPF